MSITDRIDAITGLPQNLTDVAPPPRSVKIEITARCNLRCSFCAQSMNLRAHGDMDRAFFERVAVEMRQAGVEELGLFYLGEPLLTPNIHEYVRFAKHEAKYPYVFMTSNATLATPKRLEKIFRAGLDSLKFSLNYATPEQFEQISRMPGKLYETMLDNIRASRATRDAIEQETGHRCVLSCSYIQYDDEQEDRMNAVVADISKYVDEVYQLPLYSQAEFVGESEREKGWKVTAGNRGRIGALRQPLPCWSAFSEGHVNWEGRLTACCFDSDGRFEMGDLTKTSFLDAWNSAKFQELRRAHIAKDVRGTVCERCMAYL